jgi:flagellar FliJ protein
MARKSTRFQTVVRYTESKEDKAAKRLAESQANLVEQQNRLESLSQYKDEYAARFTQAGQQGMRASQVREYQAFMVKLQSAVDQQQRVVEVAVQHLEDSKKQWMLARNETRKTNTLLDRYLLQERRAQDKLEQKDSDERAQRMKRGDNIQE